MGLVTWHNVYHGSAYLWHVQRSHQPETTVRVSLVWDMFCYFLLFMLHGSTQNMVTTRGLLIFSPTSYSVCEVIGEWSSGWESALCWTLSLTQVLPFKQTEPGFLRVFLPRCSCHIRRRVLPRCISNAKNSNLYHHKQNQKIGSGISQKWHFL